MGTIPPDTHGDSSSGQVAKPDVPDRFVRDGELFSAEAWLELRRSLNLSRRELDMARYIFADQKEKAIAQDLGISHHTVRTHCERLYHKLGVTSRVEMVVRLVDEFLRLTVDEQQPLPPLCSNHRLGRCPLAAPAISRR